MILMDTPPPIDQPLALLGGLSARGFMRRHWQKKSLLVRGAFADAGPPCDRAALFELAGREEVEARVVIRQPGGSEAKSWQLKHGPFARRALPPVRQPGWTLLVQGLDLHLDAARRMLSAFRFVPQARLDDVMLSWASDGGGVGPHLDSYDVFLLQVQGRRRWRYGPAADTALVPGLPLKILANFEPACDEVLEPGDLLYLPPGWAHEGTAVGECMTASIGFRAPERSLLAAELLGRLADVQTRPDDADAPSRPVLYRDPAQAATAEPGRVPAALQGFSRAAVERALRERGALELALGEALTEPQAQQWFIADEGRRLEAGVMLAPATRMLYDDTHVFINGEAWRASGRDAKLLRRLADRHVLGADELARASPSARQLLCEWLVAGWLTACDAD